MPNLVYLIFKTLRTYYFQTTGKTAAFSTVHIQLAMNSTCRAIIDKSVAE